MLTRTTLLITATLPLLLTGCGQEPLPKAADGTDLAACTDADCTVRVTTGDAIPLSDEFGMTPVQITVNEDTVGYKSTDGGSGSFSVTTVVDAEGRLQNIAVKTLGIKDGEAVIEVTNP